MHFLRVLFSAFVRSGSTGASVAIPGLGAAGDLLGAIIALCDCVPQNKNAARRLAQKCEQLCTELKQYENRFLPDPTVQYRTKVFTCLENVKKMMEKWSKKNWLYMLVHQGEFEVEFDDCEADLSQCFTLFMTAGQMESLAYQNESERWRMNLKESHDADHKALMKQLSDVNFVQQAMEARLIESRNDTRTILMTMQQGLAERQIMPEDERNHMIKNLYDLLRLSKQLPPQCQLSSGEVEWSDDIPTISTNNIDVYKGRFLGSEDVKIKVIRFVNMRDEKNVERIRREAGLWAEIHRIDQGRHIIPFYGFYSPDGLRLLLVSPWIDNGNATAYVKNHDRLIDYKKLILGIAEGLKVLHSMNPPVIHGNLRGEKVLIGNAGQPLITDFALAKLEGNVVTRFTGTQDGYRWCAPEMWLKNSTVSTNIDIYSFGMTILELFTHKMPYDDAENLPQVVTKKLENDGLPDRPQDALAFERGLDDRMWELLCVCWSRDPQGRPSIDELLTQL
ncbi:kinase-like domain-containing protein [Amanita rubescens]|nr:kinase-like domain-containing protein [Amanita rubescens]